MFWIKLMSCFWYSAVPSIFYYKLSLWPFCIRHIGLAKLLLGKIMFPMKLVARMRYLSLPMSHNIAGWKANQLISQASHQGINSLHYSSRWWRAVWRWSGGRRHFKNSVWISYGIEIFSGTSTKTYMLEIIACKSCSLYTVCCLQSLWWRMTV